MVTYPYEDLGPERFQELCQALIVQQFPRAQCMPIGMPDGGRDAVVSRRGKDTLALQVKYRRKTPLADATHEDYLAWLKEAVTNELPNITRLINKGVKHYILISNVPCSSHSETGTRDKMLRWLSEQIADAVDFEVWWRDDLDRRIDPNWEIKRTYALTSSSASADALLAGMTGEMSIASPRFHTIRKFIRSQYERDSYIRFREAELPNQPLLQSYLDVGAQLHLNAAERRRFVSYSRILKKTPIDPTVHRSYYDERYTGAGILLQLAGTSELTRTVIEGGPGQGKSTLVQYVCQVHRARLLARDVRTLLPEYRLSPILLPFRTDLRDLAAWLQNENPFGETANISHYPRSVEGFLAAMVHVTSGGGSFTVDDLDEIVSTTPTLLVFDGLDEVADIETRTRVVNELLECTNRLQEIGRETRFVVTSRPSAFSAAPRFPSERFTYVTLRNLTQPLIMEYTKTWMRTRRVEADEARKITKILSEKLREPHIAELARNSMQLAILLFLIYQQQGNLPEQRTSLYEQYISRFLIRESSKNRTMREHGGTILQLHGYLAWVLHARAESGRSQGNIGEGELKQLLRQYLQEAGYTRLDLVDELFQGMAERFIALVSRVQGTWEFEVQPLREYFAAYHLYDTARMSRAGKEVTGTKADRFDAISRKPYWFNVTRFYVGFFDKGELAYLLHQFRTTFAEGPYRNLSYPRSLANSILADQVFVQSPAMGRELAHLITQDSVGWFALANGDGMGVLQTPLETGGREIIQHAKDELIQGNVGFSSQVVTVLNSLADRTELASWWLENLTPRKVDTWLRWMLIGIGLEVLSELRTAQLLEIFNPHASDVLDFGLLYRGSATKVGIASLDCGSGMIDYLKSGISLPISIPPNPNILDLASFMLYDRIQGRFAYSTFGESSFTNLIKRAASSDHLRVLHELLSEISRQARKHRYEWQDGSAKIIADYLGDCWLATRSSLMHFLLSGQRKADHESCALLDASKSLDDRLACASLHRADAPWWEESISSGISINDSQLLVVALICTADEDVISALLPLLSSVVDRWPPEVAIATLDTISLGDATRNRLNARQISLNDITSPILMGAVASRLRLDQRQQLLATATSAAQDQRIRQLLAERLLDTCISRISGTGRWVGTKENLLHFGTTLSGARYSTDPWFRRGLPQRDSLDAGVADLVLQAPEKYPPELVTLADRSALETESSSAPLVSEVAIQDHWFDQDQPF